MKHVDLLVVGGGAAGMAAALAAKEAKSILLIEREEELGGVLNQCLHEGFGLRYFGRSLTGTEYAEEFRRRVENSDVTVKTGTTVLRIDPDRTALLSGTEGFERVGFSRCILSTGCRERPLGAIDAAGTRPAGILTAGTAQRLVNRGGYEVGERIVILGSGDIGQIMARHFAQLGKEVVSMVELRNELGGLARNRKNCIEAYHIPVILSATVERVHGTGRIEGVTIVHVDTGEREYLACDTLVTALGLIPERELVSALHRDGAYPDWLTLCGNCEHVHEIVDSVTAQAEAAGAAYEREDFL